MATNKNAAVSFLRLAASGRAREALATYGGPGFRHHNPWFPGDADSLAAAMDENARQNPDKRLDVLRAVEEGDLVAVHSYVKHGEADRGFGLVHIFRFEAGRIVELWDLAQEVPAESPNANGMF
jgi:predicted SnoaL-like aldol condensation-catalyzing enzyme